MPTPGSSLVKIARNGAEIGEYKAELIPALIEAGVLKKTDHYWTQGMSGWLHLSQLLPQPISRPQVFQKPSGAAWWLVGGFLMPYFFAWRIIFDKAYGFSVRTKMIYSVWLASFALMIFGAESRSSSSNYDSNRTATSSPAKEKFPRHLIIEMGQKLVRQQLKAPSTAKFSNETYAEMIKETPHKTYCWIEGEVDAQNVFGAMLRTKYALCYSIQEVNGKYSYEGEYSTLNGNKIGTPPEECREWFSKNGY